MYWGQGCSVDRNLEVHTSLLHYCTFGLGAANDAHDVRSYTSARGKDNDQQNISKMIMWYRRVYNQTASVYKLMTDKPQLMLINVLLHQFLNNEVSQASVATFLRFDGIFNDQFITQSLLSPWVKKILKIGQHLPKLRAIMYRVVFYDSRVVSEIFNVEKCRDLEIRVRGLSRSLKVVPFDILPMVSY